MTVRKEFVPLRAVRDRFAPRLLLVGGMVAIAFAAFPDFLRPPDARQLGAQQVLMLALGCAAVIGASIAAKPEWRRLGLLTQIGILARDHAVLALALTCAQLALIVAVFRQLQLENAALVGTILPLTIIGFAVHHFLAPRFRLPFFALLSLFGVVCVFGPVNGGWLIGAGLLLIAAAHLPLAFGVRVVLLLGLGVTLAMARAGQLPVPWSSAIWPILGSMFMFRLIVYMYDLRHSKQAVEPWRALSYFFLLPNVVFPLFPVVDYATFRRTHFDQDRFQIYQRGVEWMLRGTVHLILYRVVYHYLVLAPADVTSATDLARYLVANFLLYLRISGQFHLIVGMLHLFGFRLPETHHFFYLASSFTDFWRRINIYWKDFMQKVFYYPAYFRLRRRGETLALVLSTLFVFFTTWFFHSYQWFWILGKVLLSWTDTLFWAILAVLLIGNSLWEMKRGRKRAMSARRGSWSEAARRAGKVVATFTTICILWSLWTSATISDFLGIWQLRDTTADQLGILALVATGILIALTIGFRLQSAPARPGTPRMLRVARTSLAALLLALAVDPGAASHLHVRAQAFVRDLRVADLNAHDATLLQRGYYEQLNGVRSFNSQLWELYSERPTRWPFIWQTEAAHHTGDFLFAELKPMVGTLYRDKSFRTNQWGMRDQDYSLTPSPGTYRFAIAGPSYVMGDGVADGETFESVLERRLNLGPKPVAIRQYEILNFAMSGYTPAQQLLVLEQKITAFKPDVLLVTGHANDISNTVLHVARMASSGVAVPFDSLASLVARAGVVPGMTGEAASRRIRASADQIVGWVYDRMVGISRQHGIRPVWVFVPTPGEADMAVVERLAGLARAAGFETIRLEDVYAGYSRTAVQIARWDWHPNAFGHALIAARLHDALGARSDLIGHPPPSNETTESSQ